MLEINLDGYRKMEIYRRVKKRLKILKLKEENLNLLGPVYCIFVKKYKLTEGQRNEIG